jgi:Fe-S oxidoreductase
MSQGMLRTARSQAHSLQQVLAPLVTTGQEIVGVEPSCLSAVVDDHRKLLPAAGPDQVAAGCHDILEYLRRRIGRPTRGSRRTASWRPAPEGGAEPLVLHGHCQQKTLGWMPAAVELLGAIPGVDVRVTSTECCGMAGSFGYKRDFYPLSVELGRRLVNEIDTLGDKGGGGAIDAERGCHVLACGTSCRAQIVDVGKRRARHPVELIDERLDNR